MSKSEPSEPEIKSVAEKVREIGLKWSPAFEMTIMLSISVVSVLVRVFSVISIIYITNNQRI